MSNTTADSPAAPTWRQTDTAWEIHLGGHGIVTVPFDAIPADALEQIKRFADGFDLTDWRAQQPPTTVTEALCRVMAELPGIGKDQQSPQGYNYRGIEAITQHAQHLFARYGVIFGVPRILERKTVELVINGKPWTEEQLTVEYTIYGPSHRQIRERRVPTYNQTGQITGAVTIDEIVDDSLVIGPLIGLGRDNADKGTNKALTQVYKYALIQTLCIGDAKDDADSDKAHEADTVGAGYDDRGPDGPRPGSPEWIEAAKAQVKDTLKALTTSGDLEEERAAELWKDWQAVVPIGESEAARERGHNAWWQEHLAGLLGASGDTPTDHDDDGRPFDGPPADPQGSERPLEGSERPVTAPADPTPATGPEEAEKPPWRDDLDAIYVHENELGTRIADTEAVLAAIDTLDRVQLASALEKRGGDLFLEDDDAKAALLGLIMANNPVPPVEGPGDLQASMETILKETEEAQRAARSRSRKPKA